MAFFGRREIYTSEATIDASNIVQVLYDAYNTHLANANEITGLYKRYCGNQPILSRVKEVRPEICNKIVENRANEIVSFKVSYLCGEPIQYISRSSDDGVAEKVAKLNSMMLSESKATKDKELFEWNHIGGTAYRMVLPNSEYDPIDETPFEIYTLDPREAFVIKSNRIGKKPMCGVYTVKDKENRVHFYAYTPTDYYEVVSHKLVSAAPHTLGRIPIIEYPANTARLGAFEVVCSLLDAINEVDSNRLDGIEQFVQSLLVIYNANFDDGVTAKTIRESGMVLLKSIGENKADIKEIAEQLDQSQTQTLKDDLYRSVLSICGMPSQSDGTTSDSSNNGAVILRNGWQAAEARAKDSELMFKRSEQEMLKLVLHICSTMGDMDLKISDIDYRFTRRQYDALLTKSQVLTTMLSSDKIHPRDSFNVCGLFIDPETAYQAGMEWYEEQKANSEAQMEKQLETERMNRSEENPAEEERSNAG